MLDKTALTIAIIGALNWGSIGIFGFDLVAALLGGQLFGLVGIIFFIPLTAVVLELVKEDVCRRLRTKETLQ